MSSTGWRHYVLGIRVPGIIWVLAPYRWRSLAYDSGTRSPLPR